MVILARMGIHIRENKDETAERFAISAFVSTVEEGAVDGSIASPGRTIIHF
jgi:hypothetical protein